MIEKISKGYSAMQINEPGFQDAVLAKYGRLRISMEHA